MNVAKCVRTSLIGGVTGLWLSFGSHASAASSAELTAFKQAIRAKYDMKMRRVT